MPSDEATADALRFLIKPLKDLVVEVHRLNELLEEMGLDAAPDE